MAEQLADTLTEEIVSGRLAPGDALPTEPELSEEFGVSRSVVRDATRMLAARGLVDVQHGRGAFVTASQMEAFGDALLLALRRADATVWDAEEFFARFWPEVFALAAEHATEADARAIAEAAEEHIVRFAEIGGITMREQREARADELASIRAGFARFMQRVLDATHNTLVALLGPPLQSLRSLRSWEVSSMSLEEAVSLEGEGFRAVADAIRRRDTAAARQAITGWFDVPDEAVEAMRATPIGEVVSIPVGFEQVRKRPR